MSTRLPRDRDDEQPPDDDPRPTVVQVLYGPGTDRELYVAIDDVLTTARTDAGLSAVASTVDLESVERLGHGGRFEVEIPLPDGSLLVTNSAVRFEQD